MNLNSGITLWGELRSQEPQRANYAPLKYLGTKVANKPRRVLRDVINSANAQQTRARQLLGHGSPQLFHNYVGFPTAK